MSLICSYKRLFRPEPYHIVQEIQKYNLPGQCWPDSITSQRLTRLFSADYRPRMEQFQKVMHAVRRSELDADDFAL